MVEARGTYLCGSPSPARSLPPSLPNLQSRTSPLPELVPDQLLPSLFGLSLERKTRPWCCAATSTDMRARTRRLGSKVRPARCLSIHLQKTCDARWAKLVLPPRTRTAPAVSPSRIPSTPCLATVFLTPHKTSQRWHRDATNPRAGAALQVMKPLSLSSLASPPIRRRWPQEWEEARIPRPAWTGTICCAGGTSHSSMGFILASYLVVLVSLFHRGHPPRQDRAYHAGPLPQTDCPTRAPGRASMCAKTRGSARRRWTRKPKEGNSLTHRHHRHQSTNRLNWGQNTRDGVLGPEDAADPTRGTRAQTPDEQRASRGCRRDGEFKNQEREEYLPCKDADYDSLERDISPKEMDSVLQSLATSRGSPIPGCSKEVRRGSKTEELDDCSSSSAIEELLLCTKSGRAGIEDLVGEGSRTVEVYRAELPSLPSLLPHSFDFKEEENNSNKAVTAVREGKAQYSSSTSSSASSPLVAPPSSALQPSNVGTTPPLNVADLCQDLKTKCCLEEELVDREQEEEEKENLPHLQRPRCVSETSPRRGRGPLLDPLDISFESFEFDWSRFEGAGERVEKRRAEEEEDDESVPSSNKKNAFRKSFNSATSMVFHRRTGLPLTSSPAPMRRGVKFDFDSGISNPKDIKRALFEPQSPEESECGSPKKKKRDPKKLLSTSAPASISGNNLLGNFEESVLNGRLEPVSTVEGFTAEIGASGSFQPRHLTFPVTVFFYTLCENSTVASPYLGHINLGKKGYRVPEKGTLQLTLFNPLGTVVKMFVVMYDLSDMPPSSQTFLRQRTLYMPCEQSDGHPDSRKWLRYLIDVRMIIFRKSDLDTATDYTPGKGFELRSFTRG